MKLDEMRARRKELIDKARNLRSVCDEERREMTADERKDLEEWLVRSEHLSDEMKSEERLMALEESTNRAHELPTKPELDNDEQRRAMGLPIRFRSFGEQVQACFKAAQPGGFVDPRLTMRAVTGMAEGSPSDGGFLVQTDFSSDLLKQVWDTGILSSRCRRMTISAASNKMTINGIDETSRANGSRGGGIRGYWIAEAADKTASAPTFRKIELSLKKLVGLCYATDELLDDVSALEGYIRAGFVSEFDFLLQDAIINGTGAGQPLGILNAGCLVSQAAEDAQSADTVVSENVVKMYSRLFASSRQSAVWLINQTVEPQLHLMSVPVGLGGAVVYMPPGGLSAAPYGSLLGRPVLPIEQCAALGDAGDIILADFQNGYVLAEKGGLQSAMSIHVKFQYDESVFRFVMRVDGQPVRASALTPFKGGATATQSHFVTLAARA
jgi:HK97 family phage major capsid protein